MESSEYRKEQIRNLVESMLNGSVSADEVLTRWPLGPALNPEEERLSHEIGHYATDADIRAKDAAEDPGNTTYADYQIDLIRKHLAEFLDV